MVVDRVGNNRFQATPLNLRTGNTGFSDRIGGNDPNDFFQFSLSRRSSVNLLLSNLTADANVQLLTQAGQLLRRSINSGITAEAIALPLNPGTYLVRVFGGVGNRNTPYNLRLSAKPISTTNTITALAVAAPTLTLTSSVASISEAGGAMQFVVSRTGSTTTALTVNYQIGGTATNGVDYRALSGRAIIPVGQRSAAIRVQAIDDTLREANETVTLTLLPNRQYTLGTRTRTTTLNDNDTSGFNIRFDYRFDTAGWFTPQRRAALEAAADVWERIILNKFEDVPAGTDLGVVNPVTEQFINLRSDALIDDLVVFVGAKNIDGISSTLAFAGPTSVFIPGSLLDIRYNGRVFQPWTGYATFDTSENWFFDPTPETANDIPAESQDFISTAVHELGHVLGLVRGTTAFSQWVVGDTFIGPNTRAANSGQPIPLEPGGSHLREGYELPQTGETLMDPFMASGRRLLPTALDIAMLADIGYTVNFSAAIQNRTTNFQSPTPITATTAFSASSQAVPVSSYRCGCTGCLSR